MDPRLALLVFPQRFDGAKLELRLLVVPRLSASWNADPLSPLIENWLMSPGTWILSAQ